MMSSLDNSCGTMQDKFVYARERFRFFNSAHERRTNIGKLVRSSLLYLSALRTHQTGQFYPPTCSQQSSVRLPLLFTSTMISHASDIFGPLFIRFPGKGPSPRRERPSRWQTFRGTRLVLAEALIAAGHRAIALRCNVADEAQIAAMVEQTVSAFGRLDAAFNNAGVQSPAVETVDRAAKNLIA